MSYGRYTPYALFFLTLVPSALTPAGSIRNACIWWVWETKDPSRMYIVLGPPWCYYLLSE